MSVRPEQQLKSGSVLSHKKVTIQYLQQLRKIGTPISMLTAYDYPTGRACETHGVDITLVGDSLAQVCLGYDSTTRLTLDEMIHHCRAVARGSKSPLLVADMPFGTYISSKEEAIRSAVRMVQEGGVEAVKLEGGLEIVDTVQALTTSGISVMAHVGLLPQRHAMLSGYKVQGKTAQSAAAILEAALALEEAGAFSMVLEAIPHCLGAYITSQLQQAVTIGIGAGNQTNGQVLVWDDVMGTWSGHKAKFVRRFGDVQGEVKQGVHGYIDAVRSRTFPGPEESYEMKSEEWDKFIQLVEAEKASVKVD